MLCFYAVATTIERSHEEKFMAETLERTVPAAGVLRGQCRRRRRWPGLGRHVPAAVSAGQLAPGTGAAAAARASGGGPPG